MVARPARCERHPTETFLRCRADSPAIMIHKLDAVDTFVADAFQVQSDKVTYSTDHIHAEYEYQSTSNGQYDGCLA